ncbi:MAG: glycoside hydrolase family 15 protein, partial [Candidatus Dormibacteraceae bacterium]
MSARDALDEPEILPHVLREYALLADGERGILVGPRGDFAWMCFPRWHCPALFASLIGGRGAYTVTPLGRYVWGGSYEPGSLIWHSRWTTEDGIMESREALALPGDPDRAVLLRRIQAIEGGGRIRARLDLRSDFGSRPPRRLRRDEEGRWLAELSDGSHAVWTGAGEAALLPDGRPLQLELTLREGETHDLVLTVGTTAEQARPIEAPAAWLATEARWRETVPGLEGAAGARDARHAYAVLAGLTSSGGGMVAAATTSLPERAEQERNYDYRFAWIRDQCYAGQAVAAAGPLPLLDDATRFVRERLLEDGPRLEPAYTVEGKRVPDQSRIDLPG